jgi:hypothetical protein
MLLALCGSLFIILSCVGGAWLIARLGIVPVQGITPAKQWKPALGAVNQPRAFIPSPVVRPLGVSLATLIVTGGGGAPYVANISGEFGICAWQGNLTTDTTALATLKVA